MLTRRVIGRKISIWMVILQEFDLDFISAKSKKSLVFAERISKLPVESGDVVPEELPIRGDMFLIQSSDPWYGDILIYLQTLKCPTSASRDERRRIRHQAKNYLILDDTLYRRGVDCILRRCLTHEEAVIVLKYCHTGACGGHLSGLATSPKDFTSRLLLAHTYQRLYRVGQEVPSVPNLLSEDEGTSNSHVSCHHSWSLH
jgi:hypothetical protein